MNNALPYPNDLITVEEIVLQVPESGKYLTYQCQTSESSQAFFINGFNQSNSLGVSADLMKNYSFSIPKIV